MRRALWLWAAVGLLGCYRAPAAEGPFQCSEGESCPRGMACDDGLCCLPGGQPHCRTKVPASGTCDDGKAPLFWYLDRDGDGYGDYATGRPACAEPFVVPEDAPFARWVQQPGDCDDQDPGRYPGAPEICDGKDNNCNGHVDDPFEGGLPFLRYWPDADGDGAGDASHEGLALCLPREGWVDNGADCDDGDFGVRPGAPEQCNGRDDNCNLLVDEGVQGLHQPCTDPTRVGSCQLGHTSCVGGEVVCAQAVFPVQERCNGLDDDCDGAVDSRPGCGGPTNLLDGQGVVYGAKKLTASAFPPGPGCRRTAAGSPTFFSSDVWFTTGASSHVAWAEKSDGDSTPWDLSGPGLGLRLSMLLNIYRSNTGVWAPALQPLVLLCGPGGLVATYEPEVKKLVAGSSTFDDLIPLAGGNGWKRLGAAGDLSAVSRIEVLVQPADGVNDPSYRLTFLRMGLEKQ